jgi:hypothetical protein
MIKKIFQYFSQLIINMLFSIICFFGSPYITYQEMKGENFMEDRMNELFILREENHILKRDLEALRK